MQVIFRRVLDELHRVHRGCRTICVSDTLYISSIVAQIKAIAAYRNMSRIPVPRWELAAEFS